MIVLFTWHTAIYTSRHSHCTYMYMYMTTEQVIRDDEFSANVKEEWAEQGVEPQFQLRLRASGIIRVQHRLDGDQEVG